MIKINLKTFSKELNNKLTFEPKILFLEVHPKKLNEK